MAEPEPVAEPTMPVPARKRGSFGSNVLKLTSGATLAQVISVLTVPILTRLFLPGDYGVWQVFTSIVLVVSVIACLRYEVAIVLPEDDGEAANIFALSIVVSVVISGSSAIVLLIAGESLLQVLKAPGLHPYLWLVPVAILIQGLWRATNYWNTRSKRFGRLSVGQVAGSVTTSTLPMGFAALGQINPGVLISTWVAGWVVNTTILAVQVWRDAWGLFWRSVAWSRMIAGLKRYRKFALVDSVGTFFNNISWQLPPLMLAGFFSEEVVGLYSPVSRIILLPVSLIGASIAQVFFQRAAELRSQPAELARTAEMIFQRLVSLGLFPSVLLTVAGREVFTVVLGANWSEAGVYAQILAPWMFFLLVSSSLIYIFSVFERQEITLVINVVIFLSRVAALTIGGMLHNIYLALGIWSITGVAIYCGLSVWTMVLSGVPMRASGRSLLRYILYAIPAVALLLPLKLWLGVAPWVMVIVVGVLLVLYYLWALYRDPTLYRYLRSLVRARRPGA